MGRYLYKSSVMDEARCQGCPLLPSKMDVDRADNGELVYTYGRGMDEYGGKNVRTRLNFARRMFSIFRAII